MEDVGAVHGYRPGFWRAALLAQFTDALFTENDGTIYRQSDVKLLHSKLPLRREFNSGTFQPRFYC